ncbi:UNKNOWN [Stylonychia lemnae]|uniref:Polycystin cation channel PKD1/PKD2 domain-containing protein n=1 Tax=Stylonychia lemnae TaxID=5949 RepID=A0A077ZXU0_STYLE|nr:UNKNOWN [Stylonychia lemnae]|eukprot:CDW74402.1 UNKNOWN [Stylonychia lemnae]
MMGGVFKDLKYFLIFFLIFILQFGMIFLVLFNAKDIDEYNGMNKLAYFLMAFRISSGDFQLDDFQSQENGIVILSWLIWLVAVMTLNIVFMNFIIAVISESYERVMQKLVAESFRVKAHMIVEREQLYSQDDLKSTINFPNYIVVRRPLNTEINDAGEWSKAEIIQNLHQIQTQNKESNQKLDQTQENSKNEIEKLCKGFVTKQDTLDGKVDGLDSQVKELGTQVYKIQADMDFIKSSLTQMLQKYRQ